MHSFAALRNFKIITKGFTEKILKGIIGGVSGEVTVNKIAKTIDKNYQKVCEAFEKWLRHSLTLVTKLQKQLSEGLPRIF